MCLIMHLLHTTNKQQWGQDAGPIKGADGEREGVVSVFLSLAPGSRGRFHRSRVKIAIKVP